MVAADPAAVLVTGPVLDVVSTIETTATSMSPATAPP